MVNISGNYLKAFGLCFNQKPGRVQADRVTHVVEHLPSKHEAPSSNPSTAKNKTKQKKKT
jgi:hypothetical protein